MTSRDAARWATAVAALALIALVVAADRETLPLVVQRVYDYPAGDKIGHFGLFGSLACFPGRTSSVFDLLASYAGIAAGVAAAELIGRRTALA